MRSEYLFFEYVYLSLHLTQSKGFHAAPLTLKDNFVYKFISGISFADAHGYQHLVVDSQFVFLQMGGYVTMEFLYHRQN